MLISIGLGGQPRPSISEYEFNGPD